MCGKSGPKIMEHTSKCFWKCFLALPHCCKPETKVIATISWTCSPRGGDVTSCCTPPDSPLEGATRTSVDGRGQRSPRRVDIFVIPAEEKRIVPEWKDRPGINLNFRIHIGELNGSHSCFWGGFTAAVMTWVPPARFLCLLSASYRWSLMLAWIVDR